MIKIKNISNTYEFFYEKSNFKFGASENNLQLGIKVNMEEIFKNLFFIDFRVCIHFRNPTVIYYVV